MSAYELRRALTRPGLGSLLLTGPGPLTPRQRSGFFNMALSAFDNLGQGGMKLDAAPKPPAGWEMHAWLLILDEREPTGRGRPFGRGAGKNPARAHRPAIGDRL